ncbi:MAG: hypothetical protein K0S80_5165 [Neobacillus sp.]|nr:hypothetical protein [Neobacillus sp.]
MTQIAYPLANTQVSKPQEWSDMAQNWLNTGVIKGKLNDLLVYADSTGMRVKVKSGQANLQGHFYQSDSEEVLPIAIANASNPRIDRVIVRIDWTADSIALAVLQGTPAATPVAPALTQNSSRWEISLAKVLVGANVNTIAAGNVTDERNFVGNLAPTPYLSRGSTGGIGYPTSNALQQLAINSVGVGIQNDLTLSGDNIMVNTAGTYEIDVDADISGLGSGQTFELIIRAYKDGVTYGDYPHLIRGTGASAGLNLDTIWGHNKAMPQMFKGGYFQILVRITDSPRTINNFAIHCRKISN